MSKSVTSSAARYAWWIVLFVGFVLPVLGAMNCAGWNEGSMEVSSCVVDLSIARSYADFYYALLLFSAYMLLIPLGIYVVLVFLVAYLVKKLVARYDVPKS